METLTLGGKEYVKASRAARDLGYAADYVSQLCRSGKVDAHLVGRTWYVNVDMLGAHRVEKKRNARIKAREYARRSIEESRALHVMQTAKSYKNIEIRYQPDQSEVFPQVKKVHIATEKFISPTAETLPDASRSYEILNKNKKIVMTGTIPVYDAEEETLLTDTVVLSPKIVRNKAQNRSKIKPTTSDKENTNDTYRPPNTSETPIEPVTSFEEKLARTQISQSLPEEIKTEEKLSYRNDTRDVLYMGLLLGVLLIDAIFIFGIFFNLELSYSTDITEIHLRKSYDTFSDFILIFKEISS